MKTCPRCKKRKRRSSFNRNESKADGLQAYCRMCDRWYVKQHCKRYRSQRSRAYQASLIPCSQHPACAIIDRQEVLRRGKGICGICGKKVRPKWHMDHIIPVSKGGIHCYLNLQPAHVKCNLRKGNRVGTT